MKITVTTKSLLAELKYMKGAAEKKPTTIPVLQTVRIETVSGGRIKISATDLDVTLSAVIKADILQPGECLIELFRAEKALGQIKTDTVTLTYPAAGEEQERSTAEIEAGRFRVKLSSIDIDSWPNLPAPIFAPNDITIAELERLLSQSIPFTSDEESRYTLSGVLFAMLEREDNRAVAKFKGQMFTGRLAMIATNGHRLSISATKCHTIFSSLNLAETEEQKKGRSQFPLIPTRTAKLLLSLCRDKNDKGAHVRFGAVHANTGPPTITFEFPHRTVVSRLLAGQFPNFEMVLPKSNDVKVEFDAPEMIAAIRRFDAVLTDDRSKAMRLTLGGGFGRPDEILVSATDGEADVEDAIADASVQYPVFDGGDKRTESEIYVGFARNYLSDFLALVQPARVRAYIYDAATQVVFSPANGEDFTYVLMPIRL